MMSKARCVRIATAMLVAEMIAVGAAAAKTVTLAMDVTIDQVSPQDANRYHVGGHDLVRVSYDDSKVDPLNHEVRLTELSHYLSAGHWGPISESEAPASALNLVTYKLDFVASVVHGGHPIIALFEAPTGRMAMLARPDFHVLIAGTYTIDPKPLTPAQVAEPPFWGD